MLFSLVGHQEHGVDHLGEHRRDLPADAQGQALLLGLGKVATEHQAPDILQFLGIDFGFFRFAGKAGVGQHGLFQGLGVAGGHADDPVGIGEGVVAAKTAGQLRPGLAQFVTGVVIGALVVGEGLPVVGRYRAEAGGGKQGNQGAAHGGQPIVVISAPDHR